MLMPQEWPPLPVWPKGGGGRGKAGQLQLGGDVYGGAPAEAPFVDARTGLQAMSVGELEQSIGLHRKSGTEDMARKHEKELETK